MTRSITPESIAATWVMVESARAAAQLPPETKASGLDLWAFEYAQDVPPLLEEIDRLRAIKACDDDLVPRLLAEVRWLRDKMVAS